MYTIFKRLKMEGSKYYIVLKTFYALAVQESFTTQKKKYSELLKSLPKTS